jgi:hypothetical protein
MRAANQTDTHTHTHRVKTAEKTGRGGGHSAEKRITRVPSSTAAKSREVGVRSTFEEET